MRVLAVAGTTGPPPYVEVHDGDGPPALFVHGILSSRAQWLLNLPALRSVCTPVVVELWGHGRSPLPDTDEAYTPDAYVALFEQIRRTLGVDRWLVVGQSLGAALTLRYALTHPDRVVAHVFTNSNSALADEDWQRQMQATAPVTARRIEEGGAATVAAMPVHPARAKRLPEPVRGALLDDAARLDPAAVARAILHTVPASSARDLVDRNSVPTLLVAGRHERGFAEARDFAASRMPMLDVVDLDGGHAVNIAAAGAFNDVVGAFFTRRLAGEA